MGFERLPLIKKYIFNKKIVLTNLGGGRLVDIRDNCGGGVSVLFL